MTMIPFLEFTNRYIGRFISWLALLLVILTVYDVSLRYIFHAGSVRLQELEWHIFSLLFLLSAGYTLQENKHVRVDFIYSRLKPKMQAMIDIFGTLVFLLPFCLLVIYTSEPFVQMSYQMGERSPDPGGLEHRFLLKAAIPLGFILLTIESISNLGRQFAILFNKKH